MHVVRRVSGYKKIRYYTHENIGYGPVNLPDQELHTTAVWWQLPQRALERAFPSRWQALDGFLGAAYALHLVAALLTMSEPRYLSKRSVTGRANGAPRSTARGRGALRDASDQPLAVEQIGRFEPTVFLYDDTETTGLSGGSGTRAFMIGASDWHEGRLRIRQLYLKTMAAEQSMLEAFASWLRPDTTLVSYNGRCYDSPLLATRYRLSRMANPLAGLRHLDLLFPVRRRFRGVWKTADSPPWSESGWT